MTHTHTHTHITHTHNTHTHTHNTQTHTHTHNTHTPLTHIYSYTPIPWLWSGVGGRGPLGAAPRGTPGTCPVGGLGVLMMEDSLHPSECLLRWSQQDHLPLVNSPGWYLSSSSAFSLQSVIMNNQQFLILHTTNAR